MFLTADLQSGVAVAGTADCFWEGAAARAADIYKKEEMIRRARVPKNNRALHWHKYNRALLNKLKDVTTHEHEKGLPTRCELTRARRVRKRVG